VRVVPERPFGLQILAVFGGFLIGPYAAYRVSLSLSPGSELVETVGTLAFISVFLGGTVLWMGLGVATVGFRTLWSLVRGKRPRSATVTERERLVPPGYRSYVVLGLVIGVAVGLLAALATEATLAAAVSAWSVLGTVYGLILWLCAHHGYLPFPEPE
jgi:hypothetical protein